MAASDEGYQHIEHGFEPVFDERSRVLVLGSFPSVLSRAMPSTTAIRRTAFGA